MPAAGMKSADLKQSSRDKASASHCVTMPALTPNARDGERLEVRSLGRQCFAFGWSKSRELGRFGLAEVQKHGIIPPPPPPQPRTPNPQNLPKVAETTRAGTRRTPTTGGEFREYRASIRYIDRLKRSYSN